MIYFFKRFTADQDGAVTVDWVMLTAAVVGMGAAAVTGLSTESKLVTDRTSQYMEEQNVTDNPNILTIFNAGSSEESEESPNI